MEKSDEIRYRIGSKEIYEKRKETIERNFGTAKEHHAMRYTQQIGREKMAMKVGLTFACLNMKKLARILCKAGPDTPKKSAIFIILKGKIEKMKMKPRKTPDDHTICPGFVYGLKQDRTILLLLLTNYICYIIIRYESRSSQYHAFVCAALLGIFLSIECIPAVYK